jgi:hypothetical protein
VTSGKPKNNATLSNNPTNSSVMWSGEFANLRIKTLVTITATIAIKLITASVAHARARYSSPRDIIFFSSDFIKA